MFLNSNALPRLVIFCFLGKRKSCCGCVGNKIELNPYSECFSVTYPDTFWGDQFQQGVWEGVIPPSGSGKALVGETRREHSWKLQGFSTLKSLLVRIYPPQSVMKLIQHTYIFFKHLS